MKRTVVDLGAGGSPDPRATRMADLYHPDADDVFDVNDEWPYENASVHMFTANHIVEHLDDPAHFFSEAARCLVDGGVLEVTVPLGINADTDVDHEHRWTYETPEVVVNEYADDRHWDADPPLELLSRDIDVWLIGPVSRLTPLYNLAARRWPNWAAHHCDGGELTAEYRRRGR